MSQDLSGGGRIGDKSFASLALLLTASDIPILPDVRQTEEELAGKDGTLDLETRYGARPIKLTFEVTAEDEIAFQTYLADIAAAFDPTKGEQELVLERYPGKRYLVKYNGTLPIERVATIGTFTIPLKAFKPFAETVLLAQEHYELGDGMNLGMGLTLESKPTTFTITASPSDFVVYNAGTYETFPIIRISGQGSNITVTNNTTNEQFILTDNLAGGTVVIDCNIKTVRKNGLNIFSYFDGDFPKLESGDNSFTITATAPDLTIDFEYRHTYLY